MYLYCIIVLCSYADSSDCLGSEGVNCVSDLSCFFRGESSGGGHCAHGSYEEGLISMGVPLDCGIPTIGTLPGARKPPVLDLH